MTSTVNRVIGVSFVLLIRNIFFIGIWKSWWQYKCLIFWTNVGHSDHSDMPKIPKHDRFSNHYNLSLIFFAWNYLQLCNYLEVCMLGVSPSMVSRYCEGYSFFYRLQDLQFKISEGSDQNWSCPESAQLAVSA